MASSSLLTSTLRSASPSSWSSPSTPLTLGCPSALHHKSSVICCSHSRSNSSHSDSRTVFIEVVLSEIYLIIQFVFTRTMTMRRTMSMMTLVPAMAGSIDGAGASGGSAAATLLCDSL